MEDKYPSLAALKQQEPGRWRIRLLDRQSQITLIAPHGGYIEPGTSAIAAAVAGRRYNLFDFQGLRRRKPTEFHVTATQFRDPDLCALLHNTRVAMAIHSMGPQKTKAVWLGGLNYTLKKLVEQELVARGFEVNSDSPLWRGESPRNVVNLAAEYGVQLELPWELLWVLFKGPRFGTKDFRPQTTPRFDEFVAALRAAIVSYAKLPTQPGCSAGCDKCA